MIARSILMILALPGVHLMLGCSSAPATVEEPSRSWARPLRAIELERTPQRIERGRYLAHGVLRCTSCHGEPDASRSGRPPLSGREFSGHVFWEDSLWRVVAPNLTPDRATGIGTWSDDMLLRAIREGVGHDGRALHRWMPYESFRVLSDEDAAAVVAYLRSLPPVHHPLPKTMLPADRMRRLERNLEPLGGPVPMPDTSDAVARGRYFIQLADCVGCHTSWYTDYNPGLLAGGNRISRQLDGREITAFSSNITPDPSGIGGLDEAGFIALMRSGRGGSMNPIMPWVPLGRISDRDLGAVFQALRAVAPASHWITNNPPVARCAVCGQEHGLGERNRITRPEGIPLGQAALDALTGTYRSEEADWTVTVSRKGKRLVGTDELGSIELVPVTEDRCLAPGWLSPVSFERDADGRVTALVSEELPPVRLEKIAPH